MSADFYLRTSTTTRSTRIEFNLSIGHSAVAPPLRSARAEPACEGGAERSRRPLYRRDDPRSPSWRGTPWCVRCDAPSVPSAFQWRELGARQAWAWYITCLRRPPRGRVSLL